MVNDSHFGRTPTTTPGDHRPGLKHALALAVSMAVAGQISPALANLQIEEVVVTATKRETGLQDVPIALSVVTGEAILENVAADHPELVAQMLDKANRFPRGERMNGSLLRMFIAPETWGGSESGAPWADRVQ